MNKQVSSGFRFCTLLAGLAVAACAPAQQETTVATPVARGTTTSAPAGGGTAAGARTVNDGVFTTAQATRGQQGFQANCSSCHTIADFSGASYRQSWAGKPVADVHGVISTMMPLSAPGSLSAQQYSDIVAYILSVNGYPAGQSELPTTNAALSSIMIVLPR